MERIGKLLFSFILSSYFCNFNLCKILNPFFEVPLKGSQPKTTIPIFNILISKLTLYLYLLKFPIKLWREKIINYFKICYYVYEPSKGHLCRY